MARKKVINRTHKVPASNGVDLNTEVGTDLLGMTGGKNNPSLTAWEDVDETDPEKVGGSVAAIEATLKYVDSILKEDDEDLPEGDDVELDDDSGKDEDMEDDAEDFEDDGETGFGDEGDDEDPDLDECGLMEDDEDLDDDVDDMDDEDADSDLDSDEELPEDDDEEDVEDDDLAEGSVFFEGDEDLDDELPEDEDDISDKLEDDDELEGDVELEDDDEELPEDDDLAEGFLFEGDEGLDDTEVVSSEPETDLDDMEDDGDVSGAISVDLPEDIDPNDVEVTVGDSTYVPDVDSGEDVDMDSDEDLDDTDMDDMSEGSGFTGASYKAKYPGLVEDDDADIDDVSDDDADLDDDLDDEDVEDEDMDDDDDSEDDDDLDVSESAVMRALNNILAEDERSDSPLTSDPSCKTGDRPVDCECEIDDSEAEEDDLNGNEGEVEDADIPIEKGTIQPEEAEELRWMSKRLRNIMREDDEDSHKDGGKLMAKPLDDDSDDIIGDISDSLEDDGALTDVGNGAVEDGESTLGSPDEAEDITDEDDVNVVSSNGEAVDDEDEEMTLTDNYYKVMTVIQEAAKKKGNKKKNVKKAVKKALAKKPAKKGKKFKMVKESAIAYPELSGIADYVGKKPNTVNTNATNTAKNGADELNFKEGKTLENSILGNFNKSEMNSVLKTLNNAFGTGSTTVSKEIRDSQVVSEVSVPTKALPIAENATWDGVNAGKLLVETAYKSESKVNTNLLKLTHLYWLNEGADPSDYKFPIASMVEGKAQIIPEAINEATQLFASPSFILRFSESALKKIRNVLDFYNEKMGKKSPWKSNDQIQVSEAAKITMIDRTSYNPYAVLKRLSEQENAKKLINLRG